MENDKFIKRFYVINILNLLDLIITLIGLKFFSHKFMEYNPIMLYLFDNGLGFLKILVIGFGTFVYFYLCNKYYYAYYRYKNFHDGVFYFSVMLYSLVVIWNFSLLLI
jgi:hypothetical protein